MSTHANIIHYANVEDESTGEAFEVFQFVKVGGRRDRLIVERGLADDPKQVRMHLRNRNAALSPGPSYSTPFQTRMNFNLLTESFGDRSCCRKAII